MNIVFDARVIQDHFPGIGRYAANMLMELPGLLRNGETLTVLHDPNVKSSRYAGLQAKTSVSKSVHWVEYRMPIFGLKSVVNAPSNVTRQASVVHYPYYVRPLASQPPSVTTIYDAISFVYPNYVPTAWARLSIGLLHRLAIRATRKVITISQSAADDLKRFFPAARDKLVITPLAPDAIFYPRSTEAIEHACAKFDLPKHFTFYLASNKPHKNLVRLVEAWKTVNESEAWRVEGEGEGSITSLSTIHPPLLVIAGHQDPRYPDAQHRAQALGIEQRIRFIGAIGDDDAAALYSACDLFVYPSLYEGFGLTPLEAMACGAPVACSNTSSLPEVAGDAALMFDPTNTQDIAATYLRVLRDGALRTQMRHRSRAQAARYSWLKTAEDTIAVYRKVNRQTTRHDV